MKIRLCQDSISDERSYIGGTGLENSCKCGGKSNTKEGEVTFVEVDDKWWKKDSYKFCKFPKAFLMNPKYQTLSHSAMLCYVTLFDRMSLSDHNGWIDKDGNVFIYYSNKELCKTMNCSHDTATKKLREAPSADFWTLYRELQHTVSELRDIGWVAKQFGTIDWVTYWDQNKKIEDELHKILYAVSFPEWIVKEAKSVEAGGVGQYNTLE